MNTPAPSLGASVREGFRRGFAAVGILAKVMVPTYVAVDLLQRTPVLGWVAAALEPVTRVLGLPGKAAVPLVAGACVNLYAAIGALAPLGLSPREVTILGLVLGIAHGLPLETAVIRQVCPRWGLLLVARIGLALVAGTAVNLVMP